jgi:acetyl-CoA carboxylase biotin carboxylase subunit
LYRRILIANRGEIAVRVIRACRELGIATVAVYSEADEESLHVRMADEAVPIGPPPATQSYLNVAKIIEVAAHAGVDAIHPGYGFLSENPYFAAMCKSWGIDFIGPEADSIERMGVKTAARARMQEAGVPVVPGTPSTVATEQDAVRAAAEIGYPVLVKAAAGGGGRGIRTARNDEELVQAVVGAGREAGSSFGNADVYLEKLLVDPRHVELQVLADRHGHVVHVLERDSSIQRRRQKILEEAPSPALDPATREKMGAAAIAAARAVDYVGAGTIEFLLDRDGRFYFIEMNTRIQVEHPTTEMITGIDLVREQILVCGGEPLSFRQEDVQPRGWAIECRINAEDPDNRFLPSPGLITAWEPPAGPWVRLDEGVRAGQRVQPFYDSLLAKLICWGADRPQAVARTRRALDEFTVEGVKTTLPLHRRLVADPDFQSGAYHTGWLEGAFLSRAAQTAQ